MPRSVATGSQTLTEHQKAIRDAALHLLVKGNDVPAMSSITRRVNCSRETLYKWLGDRDGFLGAVVQWQALRVRLMPLKREAIDICSLFTGLEHVACDWLMVSSGETSVVLNRPAVSHAGSDKSRPGAIVLDNGPAAMARRLKTGA